MAKSAPYMPEVRGERDRSVAKEESREMARDRASVQEEGAIKALAVGYPCLRAMEIVG